MMPIQFGMCTLDQTAGYSFPKAYALMRLAHVLIADYNQQKVHILDQDGQFQQYLLTKKQGLGRPWSIDVDTEGNAWVGEMGWFKGCVESGEISTVTFSSSGRIFAVRHAKNPAKRNDVIFSPFVSNRFG